MIKAVAIDDEIIATKVIENFCRSLKDIKLEKTFNNAKEGLKYLNKFPTDLIFLDIDMPHLNGIDLFKHLKQITQVIFITSRSDYAVEGFNLNAVDYLVKPFSYERFEQAVKKAKTLLLSQTQEINNLEPKHIYIRADFSLVKIILSDILYVEGLDDYLKLHLKSKKNLVARMTMKKLIEKLPENDFVRIHRSFIVSVSEVQRVKTKTVVVDGFELPLGASYEKEALEKIKH